jgi:hypothetical protein
MRVVAGVVALLVVRVVWVGVVQVGAHPLFLAPQVQQEHLTRVVGVGAGGPLPAAGMGGLALLSLCTSSESAPAPRPPVTP